RLAHGATGHRARQRARHQHDRADRRAEADPAGPAHLWPAEQAGTALARRLLRRARGKSDRRRCQRARPGRRGGHQGRRRDLGDPRRERDGPRRFLSQALGKRPRRYRDPDRGGARRPHRLGPRQIRGPHAAAEDAAPAVDVIARTIIPLHPVDGEGGERSEPGADGRLREDHLSLPVAFATGPLPLPRYAAERESYLTTAAISASAASAAAAAGPRGPKVWPLT